MLKFYGSTTIHTLLYIASRSEMFLIFYMLLSQCFLHSELDNGRPSTTQFKDKLPWFLDALPSSDCSKGGKGAYSTSLDLSGVCSML